MKYLKVSAEAECDLMFFDEFNELRDALLNLAYGRHVFIITDNKVSALYLARIEQIFRQQSIIFSSLILPQGESTKDMDGLSNIYRFLISNSAGRKDLILNLGGGMISDLGGFAAATYMRGIEYINIPTTLLGMVDSGLGGKTAINFEGIKNVIGNFHSAVATLIYPEFLYTLPDSEIKSGMGEIIKYTLISNDVALPLDNRIPNLELILACCNIKKHYVEADAFDNGKRKILNFGHTYGHAFEAGSHFSLSHGEAVGLGMLAAVRFGNFMNITPDNVEVKLKQRLSACNMPTDYSSYTSSALEELSHDKKNNGGLIDMIFLKDIGVPFIMKVPVQKARGFLTNDSLYC